MVDSLSFYGPGAIACALCVGFSVALSWQFNHASRKYDIITKDVIGFLAIPAIVTVHLVYELSRVRRNDALKATLVMDTTSTICSAFVPIGSVLFFQALSLRHLCKLALAFLLTTACSTMTLVCFYLKRPKFACVNSGLPTLVSGCALAFHVVAVSGLQKTDYPMRGKEIHKFYNMMFSAAASLAQMVAFLVILRKNEEVPTSKHRRSMSVLPDLPDPRHKHLVCPQRLLPNTSSSIGDFDQAIVLALGIWTLLLSLRDTIHDIKFCVHGEFEYWSEICARSLERGDLGLEVVTTFKHRLDLIALKHKWEKTRSKHRKREQIAFANLPKIVCLAIKASQAYKTR